jgi:hypothetical protein
MKTLLAGLLLLGLASPATAGVSCVVPFTFVNGTVADAGQVNQNFSTLAGCFAATASAGANTDIHSLGGLTTPISPSQGGTSLFLGGTSSGSGNAQAVSTTPAGFSAIQGYTVVFIPGATNTGPATLNVNGTGAFPVQRPSATNTGANPPAFIALTGNEMLVGFPVVVAYNGGTWDLLTVGTTNGMSLATLNTPNQIVTGGANVGVPSASSTGGAYTVLCGVGPLQYITNQFGALTINPPGIDGACNIWMENNNTTTAATFAGAWTVSANIGDPYDGVAGHKYIIHVEEVGGIATFFIKALQ